MKTRSLLRSLVVAVLVTVPAVARPPHSPNDQYAAFNRNTDTIIDNKTKLKWDRFVPSATANATNASNYCRLTLSGGRLPTVKELLTLIDEEPYRTYEGLATVTKLIDPDAFAAETPVDQPYWTSTPVFGQPNTFWALDFASGAMTKQTASAALHYRCLKP